MRRRWQRWLLQARGQALCAASWAAMARQRQSPGARTHCPATVAASAWQCCRQVGVSDPIQRGAGRAETDIPRDKERSQVGKVGKYLVVLPATNWLSRFKGRAGKDVCPDLYRAYLSSGSQVVIPAGAAGSNLDTKHPTNPRAQNYTPTCHRITLPATNRRTGEP